MESSGKVCFVMVFLLFLLGCALSSTAAEPPEPEITATATDIPPTATPEPTATPTETPLPPGFEPVVSNADWEPIIEEINGVKMALVPAGCFMMGSTDEEINMAVEVCKETSEACASEWFDAEMPQHEVCFEEPFWIDVYEVTNALYGSSGKWEGHDLPRENVTRSEALAHCESRGARLPTDAEWEYAARGPDGLIYPWGNIFNGGLTNFCDINCPREWANIGFNDGYKNTAPVGSFPDGVSWVGAYDLSGNVWEFVNDWFDDEYYAESPGINPQGPASGEYPTVRGGGWINPSYCARAPSRNWMPPGDSGNNVGFRCAMSDQP